MQISLRSHLIAGSAAVLSAGVIATIPVSQVQLHLPAFAMNSAAEVALAAFANPFEQLIATAQQGQTYAFADFYNGGDVPTPGAGEANWPYAGFDQTGGDFLNYALYNEVSLGYYSAVGLLPQVTIDNQPIATQLNLNWWSYINNVLTGVTGAATAVSAGVWNFPSAVITAAQLAIGGDVSAALTVLSDAIITPISSAATALIGAGTYVVSNVVAKVAAVIAALPQLATTFAGAAVGGAALTAEKSVEITSAVVTNLSTLNFEGAWNAAVEGLLGPSGLPGLSLNLTVGAGVQTGPITGPTDIAANFVPSARTAVQAAQWTIASALSTSATPAAAVPRAARSVTPRAIAARGKATVQTSAADPVSAGAAESKDTAKPAAPQRVKRAAKAAR